MYSSNRFLRKCQELHALGVYPDFTAGTRVARGFADLGFEEFWFIPPNSLVSLFTGKKSDLTADDKRHFFVVPDSDELLDEILRRGVCPAELSFREGRSWHIESKQSNSRNAIKADSPELCSALIDFLLTIAVLDINVRENNQS